MLLPFSVPAIESTETLPSATGKHTLKRLHQVKMLHRALTRKTFQPYPGPDHIRARSGPDEVNTEATSDRIPQKTGHKLTHNPGAQIQ